MRTMILAALLLAAPLAAELTPAEKAEVQKLYAAGIAVTSAWELSHDASVAEPQGAIYPLHIYRIASVKTGLVRHALTLLHVNFYNRRLSYPQTYCEGDCIPGRAALVQEVRDAWPGMVTAIQRDVLNASNSILSRCTTPACTTAATAAVAEGQKAFDAASSFDASLAYENPLLPNFPLQFGPHGNYEPSMHSLDESRRQNGYILAFLYWYRDPADNSFAPVSAYNRGFYRTFAHAWGDSMDMIHRVSLLGGHVPATASDWSLVNEPDEHLRSATIALVALQIVNVQMPPKFAAMSDSLIQMEPAQLRRNTANGQAMSSWTHTQLWSDRFLQFGPVPPGQ